MPKRSGGKFADSHTTVIDAAVPLVDLASNLESVSKIVLGLISQAGRGSGARSVKVSDEPAGLFLKVRGNSSVQEIRIYTGDKEKLRSALRKLTD